jgi:hypothetical protein
MMMMMMMIILEASLKHKYYFLEPAGREKTGSDRPYPLCIHTRPLSQQMVNNTQIATARPHPAHSPVGGLFHERHSVTHKR